MTREERIAAIVEAIAQQGKYAWMLAPKARRQIAEVALDAADATRPPCDCRQCNLDRLANGGGL